MALQQCYVRTRDDGVEINKIYSDSLPKKQIQYIPTQEIYINGEVYCIKNKHCIDDFIELDMLAEISDIL